MSVQRWELTDRHGEPATENKRDDGDWISYDDHAAEVARLREAGQALRDATDSLVVGSDPQVGGSPDLIRAMNSWDALAPAARKETT